MSSQARARERAAVRRRREEKKRRRAEKARRKRQREKSRTERARRRAAGETVHTETESEESSVLSDDSQPGIIGRMISSLARERANAVQKRKEKRGRCAGRKSLRERSYEKKRAP